MNATDRAQLCAGDLADMALHDYCLLTTGLRDHERHQRAEWLANLTALRSGVQRNVPSLPCLESTSRFIFPAISHFFDSHLYAVVSPFFQHLTVTSSI